MSRPTWNEYFKQIVEVTATRSSCERLKVGCLLVKDNRIVAQGYNGFLPGCSHFSIVRNGHEQSTVHAEQNAIIHAAKTNLSVNDAILVCNRFPCHNCALSAVQAGIKTIVTIDPGCNVSKNWEKSFKISEEIFKELKIKIIKFDEKDIK